jgi:hypothetical protein
MAFWADLGMQCPEKGCDWNQASGRAFQAYAERRRQQRDHGTRRLLADFVIGAHAQIRGVSPAVAG